MKRQLLNTQYYDIDIYPGNEDWQELQVDYSIANTQTRRGDSLFQVFDQGDRYYIIQWDSQHALHYPVAYVSKSDAGEIYPKSEDVYARNFLDIPVNVVEAIVSFSDYYWNNRKAIEWQILEDDIYGHDCKTSEDFSV